MRRCGNQRTIDECDGVVNVLQALTSSTSGAGLNSISLGNGFPIGKQQPRWTQVRGRPVWRRGWERPAKREPLTS